MPDVGAFRFLLLFSREVERVTQKNICVPLVPRIASYDGIKRFGKSNFLHGMKKARPKRAPKHNRQTRTRQLLQDLESFETENNGGIEGPAPAQTGKRPSGFLNQFSKWS